jgi:FG-GAP-like repeat
MKMRWIAVLPVALGLLVAPSFTAREEEKKTVAFPHFRMQEIETGLSIGYAVLLVDVNGDGKLDIVVVDTNRVVWYENPTWKRRVIIENQTKPDNVCIAAYDIDGDGQIDFALGAGWKGANPKAEGTIQWLRRGKTLDEKWTVYPIGAEPTVHRMRFADIDGDGKPELVVAPLVGRNSTSKNNWMDGPVRILAYKIPKDPVHGRWVPEVVDEHLHVVHNFWPVDKLWWENTHEDGSSRGNGLLTASYEGVNLLSSDMSGKWTAKLLNGGNQTNPARSRGASEIKAGRAGGFYHYLATIEPWHGNQVVIYMKHDQVWQRSVIDDQLKWGHAVWCDDLDGDYDSEVIVGVRDELSMQSGQRRGVRIYKMKCHNQVVNWTRQIIDDGGIAVEDLAAADLNGDGRIDIVAVGRQTHNVRIYWNEGVK